MKKLAKCDETFRPLIMPHCFRIFYRLEVVTPHEQDRFDPMLREMAANYGGVEVRNDVGAFLGFAGHPY